MSQQKFKCPLPPGSGTGTFSDNLVGNQFTDGSSEMTQANFLFDSQAPEKDDRFFITDDFSKPVSMDDLDPQKVQAIQQKTNSTLLKFYKSKDDGSYVSLYGSLSERMRVSVNRIVQTFPAALVSSVTVATNILGLTASGITYNQALNRTFFRVPQVALKNDFDIEYTTKGNVVSVDDATSDLRNFTKTASQYVVDISGSTYPIILYTAPSGSADLLLTVTGAPFSGSTYNRNFLIRPNDHVVEEYFYQLDDLEAVLLNRETYPKYQASFKVPEESEAGVFYRYETAVWPLSDGYNLDVSSNRFSNYLTTLTGIGDTLDNYKSNLITRLLITDSLQEFDTPDQKIDKMLKVYGHSFDDVKNFIDNIADMVNVSYDRIDNIPDMLLKNLCDTLGLESVTTYTEDALNKLLYKTKDSSLIGEGKAKSVAEADVELFRRLLVNIGHLFKSKGTRKAIEFLLRLVGAPDSLIDFNEHTYRVESPLNAATVEPMIEDLVAGRYKLYDVSYVNGLYKATEKNLPLLSREDFPMDSNGYPTKAAFSDGYFFQKGAGWYERTTEHKGAEVLDTHRSVLTGTTKVIKTRLNEFTYGEPFLDRYRHFPVLNFGFNLTKQSDNQKVGGEDSLTLNVKNIDLTISAAKGLEYDVWRSAAVNKTSFGNLSTTSGITFAEFADKVVKSAITGVNTIKYIKRYTNLFAIYTAYYNYSGKPFTYDKIGQYINKIGPYWIRIVEQFIPATTIWSGGNKISNSILHRQKFQFIPPCKPIEVTEPLFPANFSSYITSSLSKQLQQSPRGLCILSGITIAPTLDVNDVEYLGTGTTITPTGYTPPSNCGLLAYAGSGLPIVCNYQSYLTIDETTLENNWTPQIQYLIDKINTEQQVPQCGATGFTQTGLTITFTQSEFGNTITTTEDANCGVPGVYKKLLDYNIYNSNGTAMIDFKTYVYGYGDCISDISVGFKMTKQMVCYDCCDFYAELSNAATGTDCTVANNLTLSIHNGMPPYRVYVNGVPSSGVTAFTITTGATCDQFNFSGVNPTTPFEVLVGDAANCQSRLQFLGLENICLSGSTFVCQPIQEVLSSYDLGLQGEANVYKFLNHSVTGATLTPAYLNALSGGTDYVLVKVKNLTAGDLILGGLPNTTGFNYKVLTVQSTHLVYSNKSLKFNSENIIIPDQLILSYNSGYYWQHGYDAITGGTYLGIYNYTQVTGTTFNSHLITTTGITFDNCTEMLYYNILTDYSGIGIFNGVNNLLLSNMSTSFKCMPEIVQPTPTPTPSPTTMPTPTPSITPSVTPTLTPSVSRSIGATPTPSVSVSATMQPTPTTTPSASHAVAKTTTDLIINKDFTSDIVTVTINGVPYRCDATSQTCTFYNIFNLSQNYTLSVSVQPSNGRTGVPIEIEDSTGSAVASCQHCTTLTGTANSGTNGITVFVGI